MGHKRKRVADSESAVPPDRVTRKSAHQQKRIPEENQLPLFDDSPLPPPPLPTKTSGIIGGWFYEDGKPIKVVELGSKSK